MMVNSQNGWKAYPDTSTFVRTWVEFVGFWSANKDVAVVLDDFTQWYHNNIEPITLPVREKPGMDDWSYNNRLVRGSTSVVSNHGSATARDLNATLHPRGVHNTYTKEQRAKLKAKIESYDGVLRHGEFYNNTIDGMHVEINTSSKAAVKKAADKIRAANKMAADKVKESDMTPKELLEYKVSLSPAAAKALGRPGTKEISLNHLIQWGGPGQYQIMAELKAANAQIKALTAAINGIVEGSETDVKNAFSQGVTEIKEQIEVLRSEVAADADVV